MEVKRIDFSENTKLTDVLKTLKNEPATEVEIFIDPQSSLSKSKLNKEVIKLVAAENNKRVIFKEELADKEILPATQTENFGFMEGKELVKEAPSIPGEESKPEKKPRFSFSKLAFLKKQKWLYLIIGVVILLVGIPLFLFWLFPSATVNLFTEPQFKENELTLTASATASEVDEDKNIIPLKILETTQEDVLESKSTGTKTIGTAAKGTVKIINHDPVNPWTFYKGLILTPKTCPNTTCPKITFSLDDTATVSAAPLPNYGEASAKVTATAIGEEGNLPSGSAFQIGTADIAVVFATNDANFSEGTSKKVTVVSADDQKKAKEELLKKLEEKAKEALKKEDPNISIPEGGLEAQILDEVYTKKIDEETDNFSLNLKVKFAAKVFSEDDLKKLLIKSVENLIPSGFEIDKEKSEVDSEVLEKNATDLKVLGQIKAALVPKINQEEVRKNIAGKNFSATDRYLKSLNNITGFDINVKPTFFRVFNTMPFRGSKIEIKVVQKE